MIDISWEGARILVSHIFTHYQDQIYLTTNLNPILFYPLAVVSFSSKTYQQIERCITPNSDWTKILIR